VQLYSFDVYANRVAEWREREGVYFIVSAAVFNGKRLKNGKPAIALSCVRDPPLCNSVCEL